MSKSTRISLFGMHSPFQSRLNSASENVGDEGLSDLHDLHNVYRLEKIREVNNDTQ